MIAKNRCHFWNVSAFIPVPCLDNWLGPMFLGGVCIQILRMFKHVEAVVFWSLFCSNCQFPKNDEQANKH